MDLIIEFIGEIIIEGIIQLIQNKKISCDEDKNSSQLFSLAEFFNLL